MNDTQKLELAVSELERCLVDLFEAEDKFHVLKFYIKDKEAYDCAENRSKWMNDSSRRVEKVLKAIK